MDDDDDPELRRPNASLLSSLSPLFSLDNSSSIHHDRASNNNHFSMNETRATQPIDSMRSQLYSSKSATNVLTRVLSSLVYSEQQQHHGRQRRHHQQDDQSLNNQMTATNQEAPSTWSLLIEALFFPQSNNGHLAASLDTSSQLFGATNSTTIAGQLDEQQQGEFQIQWGNFLLALILIMLMLTTAVGNLFVIVAILIEKNLHTVGNYLVLSLAIADLLVALLVMPLAGIYQILEQWTLGILLCDIWTSADVFCCTASILHLLAIALDRYWAVTRVDYIRCQRNESRILFMIFLVWITAAIISLAPIFGWKDEQFEWRITHEKECLISQDIGYQIFATCTTFYFPLILTLIFYWKIYQVARKRIRRKLDNRAKVGASTAAAAAAVQHPSSSSSALSTPSSKKLLNHGQTAATLRRKLLPSKGKPNSKAQPITVKCSERQQQVNLGDSSSRLCDCLCHSAFGPPNSSTEIANQKNVLLHKQQKTIDDNRIFKSLDQNLEQTHFGCAKEEEKKHSSSSSCLERAGADRKCPVSSDGQPEPANQSQQTKRCLISSSAHGSQATTRLPSLQNKNNNFECFARQRTLAANTNSSSDHEIKAPEQRERERKSSSDDDNDDDDNSAPSLPQNSRRSQQQQQQQQRKTNDLLATFAGRQQNGFIGREEELAAGRQQSEDDLILQQQRLKDDDDGQTNSIRREQQQHSDGQPGQTTTTTSNGDENIGETTERAGDDGKEGGYNSSESSSMCLVSPGHDDDQTNCGKIGQHQQQLRTAATNWRRSPAMSSITSEQRRRRKAKEAPARGDEATAAARGDNNGDYDGGRSAQLMIRELSQPINLLSDEEGPKSKTTTATAAVLQQQLGARRKSSIGPQRQQQQQPQLFHDNDNRSSAACLVGGGGGARRKRNSMATTSNEESTDEINNICMNNANMNTFSRNNLINDSSSSQFSLSIANCDENEQTTNTSLNHMHMLMMTNQQHSSLCDDIDCCACECNCNVSQGATTLAMMNDHIESLDGDDDAAGAGDSESDKSKQFVAGDGTEVDQNNQGQEESDSNDSGEHSANVVVVIQSNNNNSKSMFEATPPPQLNQKQTVLSERDGQISCDLVVGLPSTTAANNPRQTTAGEDSIEKRYCRWPARALNGLSGWLLANHFLAICWRQLRTRVLNKPPTGYGDDDQQATSANRTILVDKFGKCSLVVANGAWQPSTANRCDRCLCATKDLDHLIDDNNSTPPSKSNGQKNGHQLSLNENDLIAMNSIKTTEKPTTNLIVAASTANIAVTTTVRSNNNNGHHQVPTIGQQQHHHHQQQHNQSMSIEGVESKRERKAAKTLSIITGVFVMCWLPFFIMAITMPLLQLRPHKYVFAVLLWLGYVNSMLNPIIYTIFSPDFRKAFKHLLCGMQLDSNNNNSNDNNNARRRRLEGGGGNSIGNGTAARDDWNQFDKSGNGYLHGLRQRVALVHPILAMVCCCCCCCCISRATNYNNNNHNKVLSKSTNNRQRHNNNRTTAIEPPSVSWCNNSNNVNNMNSNSPIQSNNTNCLAVSGAGGGRSNNNNDNISGSFDDNSHCTVDTMASTSLVQTTPVSSSHLNSQNQPAAQVRRPLSSITNNF